MHFLLKAIILHCRIRVLMSVQWEHHITILTKSTTYRYNFTSQDATDIPIARTKNACLATDMSYTLANIQPELTSIQQELHIFLTREPSNFQQKTQK